ncbi:hypothetical protein [Aliikangiella coralliicola]|uniref:Uncharacterized protein n=1 Tax=Aliikangiella coralliicola TaxID=2592383 RepID=A0A545U8L0_9GAMM|nr:hypothetical protein [Aliikangiella coralliicola]TQV85804.1 hypothetical protein FLL46_17925 [Aliikangiella coralliicola]
MVISISAPGQLISSQTNDTSVSQGSTAALSSATLNVANSPSSNSTSANISASTVGNVGITPAPVIQVNQDDQLESPFIEINRQVAQDNNINQQSFEPPPPQDSTLNQLRELTTEQQDIQSRQDALQQQEQQIEREISQLQQKELEINRKRFQLQQQSIGNFINFQV